MNINKANTIYSQSRTNPSFGSLPICKGSVIRHFADGTKKSIPVELHLLQKEDVAEINKITKEWQENTHFGKNIIQDFLNFEKSSTRRIKHDTNFEKEIIENPLEFAITSNYKTKRNTNFFALRPVNESDFGNKEPLCLAKIASGQNVLVDESYVSLVYLQTAAQFLRDNPNRLVSGCGEMMMYGLAKIMKALKVDEFYFVSAPESQKFYEKIFQTKPTTRGNPRFELDQYDIREMIERTEKKHGLPDTEIPKETINKLLKNNH